MKDFPLLFIIFCYLVQITFWIFTLFWTKKTSENRGGGLMRFIAYFIILLVIFLKFYAADIFPPAGYQFWSHSLATSLIGDAVTLFGAVIMIWARIKLGKNWSANIIFRKDHELITSGPYAYVRHPIYAGLVLMLLGVAIYSGSLAGFFIFGLFFIGAHYKAFKEEKLLLSYFPKEYAVYKKEVGALIPFVF
jgi:protein-S-isoprenylcysteine O-methyltransferase Ste14